MTAPSATTAEPQARAALALRGRTTRFAAAATLFFFSGALGLGYELVWIRKAALVVGASQIAMSTVLTSFFLGLGLGSYVVGRWRRGRRLSSLSVYGAFELGIGLFALAFPWLFAALEAVYGALYPIAQGSGALLFLLRFGLLFALCLPPTFLMGGTLPLLLDGLVAEDRAIGSRTSLLYGINILGAVFGVLLTCYVAIPAAGLNGTSQLGGLGNLALGGAALLLFRGTRPLHADDGERQRPARVFTLLAFATGAIAIAWQICQARFFSLLDVTTIYTTAMLLAVYLLALSTGSLLLAPLLGRRWSPLRILAVVQLFVPAVGMFSFHAWRLVDFSPTLGATRTAEGAMVPIETMQVRPRMAFWSEVADTVFFGPLLQIGLVVFVPVALMGVCLPALIAAATRHSAGLRSVSGTLVFWNTVGSSCGAFLAGYLLLPGVGLHWSLTLLGVASLALGLVAWRAAAARAGDAPARGGKVALVAGVVGALVVGAFALVSTDLTRYSILHYGYGKNFGDRTWVADWTPPELVEISEGAVGTAYVFDGPDRLELASGAVAFAAVRKDDLPGQAVQGHLPVLFFPGEGVPRRCVGICMGSGQSFGAMLMYDIESLDVVDISPSIVELSLRHFDAFNHDLARDERVSVHFDDGRHFIERAPDDHYDVVSMEPPPPRADGIYALYSLGFYREVERALTDRGVLMQWLPLYRVTPEDALCIVKTQAEVFPHTFVVKHAELDFMVLSFKTRPTFQQEEIRRRCETFREERHVAGSRWGPACEAEIASLEGVISLLVAGPETLAATAAPALYDDDHQLLCYGTGDRWLWPRYSGVNLARITYGALPESPFGELAPYFDPPLDDAQAARATAERAASLHAFSAPDPAMLAQLARQGREAPTPRDRAEGLLAAAILYDRKLDKERALSLVAEAVALHPEDAEPTHQGGARRVVRNHFAVYRDAIEATLTDLEGRFPSSPMVRTMRAAFDDAERLEVERRARYFFP